jgi:hypothetical protein
MFSCSNNLKVVSVTALRLLIDIIQVICERVSKYHKTRKSNIFCKVRKSWLRQTKADQYLIYTGTECFTTGTHSKPQDIFNIDDLREYTVLLINSLIILHVSISVICHVRVYSGCYHDLH